MQTLNQISNGQSVLIKAVSNSELKIKLIGSIVAISSIELLKVFMRDGALDPKEVGLKIAMHVTFVFSGLLMALMDWLSNKK